MSDLRTLLVATVLACPAIVLSAAPSSGAGARQEAFVQLQSFGSRLGISVEDVQADKPEGARVIAVEPDTAAARAGIKEGDIVVEFDGERVRGRDQLTRLVRETPAGRAVKMTVTRDGKLVELTVTPTKGNDQLQPFIIPAPEFHEGPLTPRTRPRAMPPYPFDIDPDIIPRQWRNPGLTLGIRVQDLTPQLRDYFGTKEGVLVSSVSGDSPAARAGLKAGDVITAIGGEDVRYADDVRHALSGRKSGDQLKVTVVREHKTQTIVVTLGD